jgi:hypothetical protein
METRNGMFKFSALYSSGSIKEVVLRFKDAEGLPAELIQNRRKIHGLVRISSDTLLT